MTAANLLWAPRAWVGGRWRERVCIAIGADGCFSAIDPDQPPPPQAVQLGGPVLPAMVDAHSHAFQRAFVGMAERRAGEADDFWSWRDRMYGVALRIEPDELRRIAAHLYRELLAGGYTQVCEFHYLHHDRTGRPYADEAAMAIALADAAQEAGIGLTLLPVLYERAGFAQPTLREDQRRFATDVVQVLRIRDAVRALRRPLVNAGVAIHSLRAARPESIAALVKALAHDDAPIHIHVAEQTGEVDDCLSATGQRPIEWLTSHVPLDARWQLVHATHATPAEIESVGAAGAGVVICPSTEANLGDGLCDLPRWLASGAALSIGSDSQVGRSWPAELRLLEYGQRLLLRQRNVGAAPGLGTESTAERLFGRCLAGGAAAAGLGAAGLAAGARADFVTLDMGTPGLAGIEPGYELDALVFGVDAGGFAQVWVAGRPLPTQVRA